VEYLPKAKPAAVRMSTRGIKIRIIDDFLGVREGGVGGRSASGATGAAAGVSSIYYN